MTSLGAEEDKNVQKWLSWHRCDVTPVTILQCRAGFYECRTGSGLPVTTDMTVSWSVTEVCG